MKKSSCKQANTDLPPLAFDSLIEPVPLASPAPPLSGQEQPDRRQAVKKSSPSQNDTQRKRIKRLSEQIRFANSPPKESFLSELERLFESDVSRVDFTEEEKNILRTFFFDPGPDDEDIVAYLKREGPVMTLLRRFPSDSQFRQLVWQGNAQAIARSLIGETISFRENTLHRNWDQKGDLDALGEAVGGFKDVAEVPEWARQGFYDAVIARKRIPPVVGSGRLRKVPNEKKKKIPATGRRRAATQTEKQETTFSRLSNRLQKKSLTAETGKRGETHNAK